MNLLKNTKRVTAITLLIATGASAQVKPLAAEGGHVGGGDASASDFQDYINKIDAYLLTDEGKIAFPEIKQPQFHDIAVQVRPVVKNERVYDSLGVAQTCTSHKEEKNRYFQCDLQRLPKIELNNQPAFYRLTLHELLYQVDLELPLSRAVPSDFSISSRLKLRLTTFQAWVPGVDRQKDENDDKVCASIDGYQICAFKTAIGNKLLLGAPEVTYKVYWETGTKKATSDIKVNKAGREIICAAFQANSNGKFRTKTGNEYFDLKTGERVSDAGFEPIYTPKVYISVECE